MLKSAYMNKERAAQLAEKEAHKYDHIVSLLSSQIVSFSPNNKIKTFSINLLVNGFFYVFYSICFSCIDRVKKI